MRLGVAMTLEAPAHRERLRGVDLGHEIDTSVTRHAADAVIHVRGVIEEHEVGQTVYPLPSDRLVGEPTVSDGRELWARRPHLRMAIHAARCRWDAREGSLERALVAVDASDAVVARMMPMIELDRLLQRLALAGRISRPRPRDHERRNPDDRSAEGADREPEKLIGVARKEVHARAGRAVQCPRQRSRCDVGRWFGSQAVRQT